MVAKEHFNNLPFIKKIFGSGWYTTRILINDTRNKFVDRYSYRINCTECFIKQDKLQTQGIVSLILDTGIVGLFFYLFLIFQNLRLIIYAKKEIIFKLFYISLLGINFFLHFIGYPFVNIPFILFFLPKGLRLI